jgi:hypothetical protein
LLRLLETVSQQFHGMLITASPAFQVNFLDGAGDAAGLSLLKRIELRPLGRGKQYNLVERWSFAGSSSHQNEEEIRLQVERRRQLIDGILRSDLVPRTPWVVLILLQAIEAGQADSLARTGFVRYYKFLIDNAILRNISADDAELIYAILPEIAWAMYSARTDVLSPEAAEKVVDDFAERRALRRSPLYGVLTSLHQIGMFEKRATSHRFRHPYVYYFFLGEYISRHLNDPAMQTTVIELCGQIGRRETANILVFLSFHTDSDFVIRTLIGILTKSFDSAREFEFTTDRTAPINELIFEAPKHIIDTSAFAANRKRRLDSEDRVAEMEIEKKEVSGDEGVASQFYIMLTAVEILGHVLRNHYAKIEANTKRDIFVAITASVLRFVNGMFDNLSSSLEAIITAISGLSDKFLTGQSETARRTAAKRLVFYLVVAVLVFVLGRLSRFAGDENLEITYRQAVAWISQTRADWGGKPGRCRAL